MLMLPPNEALQLRWSSRLFGFNAVPMTSMVAEVGFVLVGRKVFVRGAAT
jgi:hypothetical protein